MVGMNGCKKVPNFGSSGSDHEKVFNGSLPTPEKRGIKILGVQIRYLHPPFPGPTDVGISHAPAGGACVVHRLKVLAEGKPLQKHKGTWGSQPHDL